MNFTEEGKGRELMNLKKSVVRSLACLLAVLPLMGGILPETALAVGLEAPQGTETTEAPADEIADAQGTAGESVDPIQYVMDSDPAQAAPAVTQIEETDAPHAKVFPYSSDIVMSGIFQTNRYYFKIPAYWDCLYAYAQIEVELSQLIQDVPASLTFMLNDVPITSYSMDYKNGKAQIFYVQIPLELLREGYNDFDITGYVRIYDEEGCIDDFSGANWISIRRTSFLQVGYDISDEALQIADYPFPFMSTLDEKGSTTAVAVSDKCADGELEAALLLRADLGSETVDEDLITMKRAGDIDGSEAQIVLVSLRENLPEDYSAIVNGTDLSERAMICLLTGTPNVLLITSDDEECLMEAAMMLVDEGRVTQEQNVKTFVSKDAAQVIKAQFGSSLTAGRLTMKDLMNSGMNFVGPFHQEGDIYLPFSGGYVLADSGSVSLKFRYSENLDFDRSMVTVYWGDVPVGSKKLSKKLAGGDELSVTMPEDVIGTYAGKITIAFELELPDLFCTPRMDEMPWAYVTEDSSFFLPVGAGSNFTLDQRPYPFEVSARFNDLCVVIPDRISATELDTLGHVIALYGESPSAYGDIRVRRAGELAEDADKSGNLIVLGTYNDNAMIRELNGELHFQYQSDGKRFLSNDVMILSDSYADGLASMQIFHSPYADGKAVLVVGALDEATMRNLNAFLCKETNGWKLEKDTALIDREQSIRTFELAKQRGEKKAPILKTMLEKDRETAVFTIVSTAVMLLLLLAAILILIRIYWRQKN